MAFWKVPPIAKVYEALSALGNDRVELKQDITAEVLSSGGTKTYVVEWSEDLGKVTSNDNASYWGHYMGYPIIAVLMKSGRIDFDEQIAGYLSGINWKDINKKFRNDYNKAVDHVLELLEEKGISRNKITAEADRIMSQIENLRLEQLPRTRKPPK